MNMPAVSDKTRRGLRHAVGLGIALTLAVALVVTAGGCGKPKDKGKGKAGDKGQEGITRVSVVMARQESIADVLQLTGTCEAYEETDVVPEVNGKVQKVLVDVGDHVTRGQLLVRMDTTLVAKQRIQAEHGVTGAQAGLNRAVKGSHMTDKQTLAHIRQAEQGVVAAREQLRKAEAAHRLTAEQTATAIEQAKVGVAAAEAQRRDTDAGARSQEIAQAEAAVRSAESALELARTTYQRYKNLYDQGAVAEATLDNYRSQFEVGQQNLNQAREALSLAREGARSEQRRMAALAVDQAKQALRQAEAGSRQVEIAARDVESARVGVRQAEESLRVAKAGRLQYNVSLADVQSARAGIGQAAANRDLARATEGKYSIFAPVTGVIAARYVEAGEAAGPAGPVVRIVDNDPIRVNCTCSELDIIKVSLGDLASVTVDGLPGIQFDGTVTAITPQARKDQRNYTVRVEISNPSGAIKAGMFARADLKIAEKPAVVVVSRDCIVERGQDRLAYVVQGGSVSIRELELGITSGNIIEVLSGLKAGEQVIVTGQSLLANGQKVEPVAATEGDDTETAAPDESVEMGPQPAPAASPESADARPEEPRPGAKGKRGGR